MTITTVVKQDEGDKYPTGSLVLSLINSKRSGIHEDPFRGCFYEAWSGHWKRVETISRVIIPCLYPVITQKHQGGLEGLVGHKFDQGQEEMLSCCDSTGPLHKNALVL